VVVEAGGGGGMSAVGEKKTTEFSPRKKTTTRVRIRIRRFGRGTHVAVSDFFNYHGGRVGGVGGLPIECYRESPLPVAASNH
jgi:hypothetical protein